MVSFVTWSGRAPAAFRQRPILASSLRADLGDTKLFLGALAEKLSAALPEQCVVERRGGLFAKEKPIQGEVIAVGTGRREKGEVVPMELKVGDRVVYGKYSGTQVELDGDEIILIKEADVIAKLA